MFTLLMDSYQIRPDPFIIYGAVGSGDTPSPWHATSSGLPGAPWFPFLGSWS